ncbi:MAG: DUF6049 family protein, partial [Bifidobacterium sp.]|nr:DUF6049 family protein [Bifidobacterium sp.]
IVIDAATPVVTSSSGYHLKATVKNRTQEPLPAGTLTLSTNVFYGFVSRTDIQQWAQDEVRIPTPDQLGQADVSELAPDASATVSIDVPADFNRLTAMANWGPKPVRIEYRIAQDTQDTKQSIIAQTTTFLTRSSDGLKTADTPPMNLTVAMPLVEHSWRLNEQTVSSLMTGDDAAHTDASAILAPGNNAKIAQDTSQLLAQHEQLQVVADPAYLQALQLPTQSSGIMQPGYFDISGYADNNDAGAYTRAGVRPADWNAANALSRLRKALGDPGATRTAYAWQGSGRWTMQALTQAKRQGYATVIASSGFDDRDSATVHTGKYVVPTPAGDVTVLAAQKELSDLARGKATAGAAHSEHSAAGRLARFMAQSAFYQMEQPYTVRNLLICFDAGTDASSENELMNAIEQAPWLALSDLNALSSAQPYASGSTAAALTSSDSGISAKQTQARDDTLRTLQESRRDISRFGTSILADESQHKDASSPSNSSPSSGSPQALAQQNASSKQARAGGAWIIKILSCHDSLALHALSGSTSLRAGLASGAKKLASELLGGVRITPTERVTVVSETASMPVTVSNDHPYPVRVKISSLTDSMEIVTERFSTVEVPAHGSTQTTFAIRVSTSGSTTAHLTLLDRQGTQFSIPRATPIISTLQISDMSGFAFIAAAVAFGVLGLWRQFHRKKDPDE